MISILDTYGLYCALACIGGLIVGGILALSYCKAAAKGDKQLGLK